MVPALSCLLPASQEGFLPAPSLHGALGHDQATPTRILQSRHSPIGQHLGNVGRRGPDSAVALSRPGRGLGVFTMSVEIPYAHGLVF